MRDFLLIVLVSEVVIQFVFLLLKFFTVAPGGKGLFNRFGFELVRGWLERSVLSKC